jgi:hypothetical protein
MTITLRDFLKLNVQKKPVEVCVKEPGRCAKYWTTLKGGEPNIHISDEDEDRSVYEIDVITNKIYVRIW